MAPSLPIVVLGVLSTAALAHGLTEDSTDWRCDRIDRCSCRDTQTGKVVSLHGLSGKDLPAFHVKDPDREQYTYYYDPCRDFTRSGAGSCQNVAVCQEDTDKKETYNIGYGDTAYFAMNGSHLSVTYSGGPYGRQCSPSRISNTTVYLKCNDKANSSSHLKFNVEQPYADYHFSLTSKCACPGGCPGPDRPYCPIEGRKGCSCRLSSNGQLINIESLDKPSSPLTATSGSSKAFFNPCSGIASGGCSGSTACVYSARTRSYTSYGVPGTGNFTVDEHGNVSLTYTTRLRNSTVRLVCDPSQRQAPVFRIVYITAAQLVMEMRYVCACPGQCLPPPITCDPNDDCSCTLSQGRGRIDLHSLDSPVAPLRVRVLDQSGSWNTYYYNPCTNFSVAGSQGNCENVAACQLDAANRDWSLGLQRTARFHVDQQGEDHAITLQYTSGTDDRQTNILLRCNPSLASAKLSFEQENPTKSYNFVLEGKEACPQNSTMRHQHPRQASTLD